MRRLSAIPMLFLLIAFLPSISFARPNINKPGYWIKKLRSPDKVVLADDGISSLNRLILKQNDQMADLGSFPDLVSRERLWEWLNHDPIPVYARYNGQGDIIEDSFFTELISNMNLDAVGESNGVRFGFVTSRADVRAFPTGQAVLKSPDKKEFDTFQYSSIFPGEPVALLHVSRDGQWGFFQTRSVRGWMELDKAALGEREDMEEAGEFVVVTGSMAKVYGGADLKETLSVVPMGALFYITGREMGLWVVRYPEKGPEGLVWIDGYMKKRDVSKGFLPYTRRNVILQAFKMLGEEYGWGGKDGRRDCSEFIKDLFASMGIALPRNSGNQGLAGNVTAHMDNFYTRDEISGAIMAAEPGITLLGTDGHIMLYLGDRKGNPYVIHQIFGYMDRDRLKILNKVAVTDLNIGSRSSSGPFRERIKSVNTILIPPGGQNVTGLEHPQSQPSRF